MIRPHLAPPDFKLPTHIEEEPLAGKVIDVVGLYLDSPANRELLRSLRVVGLLCLMSFLLVNLLSKELGLRPGEVRKASASLYEYFQLYRLAQFLLVFWVTARIPLNRARVRR